MSGQVECSHCGRIWIGRRDLAMDVPRVSLEAAMKNEVKQAFNNEEIAQMARLCVPERKCFENIGGMSTDELVRDLRTDDGVTFVCYVLDRKHVCCCCMQTLAGGEILEDREDLADIELHIHEFGRLQEPIWCVICGKVELEPDPSPMVMEWPGGRP